MNERKPPNRLALLGVAAAAALAPLSAGAVNRTWEILTTGNGHGFQTFDRRVGKLTSFLEAPYRFVAPPDNNRDGGISRRDLGYDLYMGVRVGNTTTWLSDLRDPTYEQQTHIITATARQNGVRVDVYYFAPFGFEANGLIMLAKVTNESAGSQPISVFSKPNLKLGSGRPEPAETGESIQWNEGASYGVETGPGGGHALYFPIGGLDHASCGADSALYQGAISGSIGDNHSCNGDAQVLVMQKSLTIAQGQSAWWGQAVLFVNDDPREPQAADFKDSRTVNDLVALWTDYLNGRNAEQVHTDALAEFEAWRHPHPVLERLSDKERKLWRQSEAVMRMGQVREARQPNRKNNGMYLAALPEGEWHTGWVRDGAYAVAAAALTGHYEEARMGAEFYLAADAGFFSAPQYLGRNYRVSACRHYGNGKEEGDFNYKGPNIQTDGWGLVLWGARLYLSKSCNLDWLDQPTARGDKVVEALDDVAQDIMSLIRNDLPGADCSIWEVHWDFKRVFSFTTAAQLRGLYDFAAVLDAYADRDPANESWRAKARTYREAAQRMQRMAKIALVNSNDQSLVSHQGVAGTQAVYRDGSTVEFLNWGFIEPSDPLYRGTMNEYARLKTSCGGYRRLESGLSLVGEAGATVYDLSEWGLLDLRIADAWRRLGETAVADSLINKLTEAAAVNDNLVPELFDPDRCNYAGVVPMVGYGAGAWQMSQLERFGYLPPAPRDTFDHCVVCEPDCVGRNCGSDGCNGECGDCGDAETCNASGQCVAVSADCGDGTCGEGEDCATCTQDCGECCGNGQCQAALGEYCGSCPADCACTNGDRCDEGARACVPEVVPVDGGPISGDDAGTTEPTGQDWSDDKASLCAAFPGMTSGGVELGLLFLALSALRRRKNHGR